MLWPQFIVGAVTHLNLRRGAECRILLRWVVARLGTKVLDMGCGDGYYSFRIAARGASVTGIDVNERRLATARRFYQHPRLEVLTMDAAALAFPDASFDEVFSACVIEHFFDDEAVLRQVARVLKPGGRFIFSADSLSNRGISDREKERHRRRYSVRTFYTADIIEAKLARAGLELSECRAVLTTPLSLALVRFTWGLDRLPWGLNFLTGIGHLLAGTVGRGVSAAAERLAPSSKNGLTLLVRAEKLGEQLTDKTLAAGEETPL